MIIDENYLIAFLELIASPRSQGKWTWYGVDRMLAAKGVLGHAIKGAEVLRDRGFIEISPGESPSQSSSYVITSKGCEFLATLAQQAAARTVDTPKPHISRRTGERCPYAGRWGVLESPGAFVQERFFKVGDVFPEGIRSDRSEGPVTWIVMSREDGGPTREA